MNYVPEPTHQFRIPSLHDSTPLRCRIYLPDPDQGSTSSYNKAAIIAHPYATLGGSFDDHVVCAVAAQLRADGYVVGTLNFRGARGSGGSTSWTGKAECTDYASFVGFIACYLSALRHGKVESGSVDLVLAGYSYGSMIVSNLDPVDETLDQFRAPAEGSVQATIVATAHELASGAGTPASPIAHSISLSAVRPRYLLIAPLLPPISSFLSLRFSLPFFNKAASADAQQDQLVLGKCPTLAVFGTSDIFASASRLVAWSDRMHGLNVAFEGCQIHGAGHFWIEDGVMEALLEKISRWATPTVT